MIPLTVGITYYNEKEMLTRCLDSLLSGTKVPQEIIVYDDCSEHPAVKFLPKNAPIRVIRGRENVGPSEGRNRLLKESQGRFIHFHDADDWFEPDWTARVTGACDRKTDVVFTEVRSFKDGKPFMDRVVGWKEMKGEDLVEFALSHFVLSASGTYRCSVLRDLGGYPTIRQSEDFALSLELALRTKRFRVLPDALVCIDLREEGRSRSREVEPWQDALAVLTGTAPRLDSKHHRAAAQAAFRVGSRLFSLGDRGHARDAFRLARQYGPPRYDSRGWFYGWLARVFGPMVAERLGVLYRALVPVGLRQRLR